MSNRPPDEPKDAPPSVPETNPSEHVEKHVLRRLELAQRLGRGAYGVVWKVIEKRSRSVIALKKCFDAFRNATDAQRTYREVSYLRELTGHENIIRLQHIIKADNDLDIYLTFDYMETDLHAVIRAQILSPMHEKYICYQLLKALKYVHSAMIVHRDVKPSNVLVNSTCAIKLCDFGLCRSVLEPDGPAPVLTDYVSTRWYRAAEVLLGSFHYTTAIDMWSVGCICGEMAIGRPVFPGTSAINQVERVIELTGRPSAEDVASLKSSYAATMLEAIPATRPMSFVELFPDASAEALDFIGQTICFSPVKRCTAQDALRHPYVAEFHNPDDEPLHPRPPVRVELDDSVRLKPKEYRDKLYEEIHRRKREARRAEQKLFAKPSNTILVEHEETMPEPF